MESQHHLVWPGVGNVVDEQSGKQKQDEDAMHAFPGLHPHIFDIQSIFLVEAIGMFDLRTIASFSVHSLGIVEGINWHD